MTLRDLFDRWLAYRHTMASLGALAQSTFANQAASCGPLTAALGAIPIDDLVKSDIDIYVARRLQTCRPVTVHAEVALLRQILNWAVDERLLAERPRMPVVSVPNTERPLPADDDYGWFLRTMAPKHGDALQFMLLTGLAPHELERLETRDYSMVTNAITIGGRPDFAVKQPSRRRDIPLNRAASILWGKWTIGTMPTHHPWPTGPAMQKAMRRHVLDRDDTPLGADGLTPKMMRKWFASKIAVEHSEAVLQRLLGHAPGSPVTRRHYVRSNNVQLREAVDALGDAA